MRTVCGRDRVGSPIECRKPTQELTKNRIARDRTFLTLSVFDRFAKACGTVIDHCPAAAIDSSGMIVSIATHSPLHVWKFEQGKMASVSTGSTGMQVDGRSGKKTSKPESAPPSFSPESKARSTLTGSRHNNSWIFRPDLHRFDLTESLREVKRTRIRVWSHRRLHTGIRPWRHDSRNRSGLRFRSFWCFRRASFARARRARNHAVEKCRRIDIA